MLLRTRACNLFSTRGKPNKKSISKKWHLSKGISFHCRNYQKIFTNCKGIKAFSDVNDNGDYDPNIREWISWEEIVVKGLITNDYSFRWNFKA
jgi:hypothetical protein